MREDQLLPASSAAVNAAAERLPVPETVAHGRVLWVYAIPITAIHLLAFAALVPWLFTWTGLVVMIAGVHVFGQGINICYHRLLAHRSFRVPMWLEYVFVVSALCCMQDTPARWVVNHRFHHEHSDTRPDPHSPLVSFLWSHVGWLMFYNAGTDNLAAYRKYAGDILRDPFYMRLEKSYAWAWVYLAHAALFAVARGGRLPLASLFDVRGGRVEVALPGIGQRAIAPDFGRLARGGIVDDDERRFARRSPGG